MDILFISPDAPQGLGELSPQQIVARLEGQGWQVNQVTGPVNRQRLRAAVRRGADVFVWFGHGDVGRLLLPDGDGIPARWLAGMLSEGNIPLAVLVACYTDDRPPSDMLAAFSDELPTAGIDTITMSGAVAVDVAETYLLSVLDELASGRELRQAHTSALEALRAKKLFAVAPELHRSDIGKRSAKIGQDTPTLAHRVEVLERQMRQVLRTIYPPALVIILLMGAGLLGCGVWSSFLIYEVRRYYVDNPVIAVLMTLLAIGLGTALLVLAWFIVHDEDGGKDER